MLRYECTIDDTGERHNKNGGKVMISKEKGKGGPRSESGSGLGTVQSIGKCHIYIFLTDPPVRADITFPRADRDRLICLLSSSLLEGNLDAI